MVPSNPSEKKRRRTNYNFSAAATVTVKPGIVGQNGTQQNIQTTSSFFTILSPTEGPLPHT